jgi:hypothetical protein
MQTMAVTCSQTTSAQCLIRLRAITHHFIFSGSFWSDPMSLGLVPSTYCMDQSKRPFHGGIVSLPMVLRWLRGDEQAR